MANENRVIVEPNSELGNLNEAIIASTLFRELSDYVAEALTDKDIAGEVSETFYNASTYVIESLAIVASGLDEKIAAAVEKWEALAAAVEKWEDEE